MVPIHFWSVEHRKFEKNYGKEKGRKITNILGMVSGWGFFLFLFGIWISPQPKFLIPVLGDLAIVIPVLNLTIPVLHLVIAIPVILIGAWFGIAGVRGTSLKVAETHRPERVVTSGIYARIRHPQYFGAICAHVGVSILRSALYALVATPLIIFYNYVTAWKEEQELIKEFGKEYEEYRSTVPKLYPRLRK